MPLKIASQFDNGQAAVLNRWADDIEQQLNALSTQKVFAVAKRAAATATPVSTGGSGITSVSLQVPSALFQTPVVGSPVIPPTGTFIVSLTAQSPNFVFAGPTTPQGTPAVDAAVGAGFGSFNSSSTTSATPTTIATQADVALVAFTTPNNGLSVITQPDPSWTALFPLASIGPGLYWKNVTAGVVTATAIATNNAAAMCTGIVTLKASGTPTIRHQASIDTNTNGGTVPSSVALGSVLAGSTILLAWTGTGISGNAGNFEGPVAGLAITDNQGNAYTQITNVSVGGIAHVRGGTQCVLFVATASASGSLTLSWSTTTLRSFVGGEIGLQAVEITNVAAPTFFPLFRALVSSDIPSLDASIITTGQLALARGGTASDLSATGGTSQFLTQASAGAAITVVQPDFPNLSGVGKISKYNNIATVANGVPAEDAAVDNTTATANIGATNLYAVPASSRFRISYYVIVNRVATTSSTLPDLQFSWTDPDNSTGQVTAPVDSATPSANTLTTFYSGVAVISAKSGTNIQYQVGVTTNYASVGATSMQYSVHLILETL